MKICSVLVVLLFSTPLFAQLETRNWFLSQNRIAVTPSGVTTGLPSPAISNFNVYYKSASVSDAAGNLLLAFDGSKIIDRNMNVMPALASVSLQAGNSKMMIQQIPNSSRYYVFYTTKNDPLNVNSSSTLQYAEVDLALNNGNGDVTSYNKVVDTQSSPAFTLLQGDDPSLAWLITHHSATDSFFVYRITAAGLGTVPVISRAGSSTVLQDYIFRELKTSPNGKMFAGIAYRDYTNIFAMTWGLVEVFNINSITGTVSSQVRTPRLSGYFYNYFSLEFSPDNRLLYESRSSRIYGLQPCGFGSSTVIQYNLCYTDTATFFKYAVTVGNEFYFCAPNATWGNIQLGADKKIHMPFSGTTVANINFPNRIGSSSKYLFNAYQVPNGNNSSVAAPDFHHKLIQKAVINNIVYRGGCYPQPVQFNITNDTISRADWSFGDPASADNTSPIIQPTHAFSSPGIYPIKAKLYDSKGLFIEEISELVEIKDPGKRLLNGWPADTSFCTGGSINIRLNVVNGIFNWYTKYPNGNIGSSSISDSININSSGKWYVEMRQNDCNGCTMLDSINVTVLPKPQFSLGADRNLCAGDSVQLSPYLTGADLLWSTGEVSDNIWVKQPGTYWLRAEYNNNGCPARDTVVLTQVPAVKFALPDDTTLCNNQILTLNPGVANASYFWQNGSSQKQFPVTQPGIYWVKITSVNGCSKADTIDVKYVTAQQVGLGNDTSLCTGTGLTLSGAVSSNATYLWSTGDITAGITVNQTGKYWLRLSQGLCVAADTISVTFNTPPTVQLGIDTSICENNILVLNASTTNAAYRWQNGTTQPLLSVSQPGSYWVEVKAGGCTVSDTITIAFYKVPAIDLGADTRFCLGDSLTLNAGNGFVSYHWNTGSNIALTTVHLPSSYWVAATTADGCLATDTLKILSPYPLPAPNLGPDGGICANSDRVLSPGAGFAGYTWNTGSNAPAITITNTGTYWVAVKDAFGCKGSDTIRIAGILAKPANFLPADTVVCAYSTLTVSVAGSFQDFLWSTGSTANTISTTVPGLYWLQVKDNHQCTGRDSIVVGTKDCLVGVYFPSAFTPNGDGKNDEFKPLVFGIIEKYSFYIYNRYGQPIFHSDTPGRGWNGMYKGQLQDQNSFVWICSYQLKNEAAKTEKGSMILLR